MAKDKDKREKLKELSILGKRLNVWALGLIAALVLLVWLLFVKKDNHMELGVEQGIDPSPTQIESIKAIGEWEFLSVSNEELVDTIRKGMLSNDELVRIYYGTLRLGINMHDVGPQWLKAHGDTVEVRLPKVGLLDKDFIDEARTQSFYESGSWSARDREALYRKAYRQMVAHCLTPQNLKTAQDNAELQFRRMMVAMGYKNVNITFEK